MTPAIKLRQQSRRDGPTIGTVVLPGHVLPVVQRACGRVAILRAGRPATVQGDLAP